MSLATNISNLATRVATEIKSVRTLVNGNAADLSSLTTTAKSNLVAAINELDSALASVESAVSALDTQADASTAAIGTLANLTTDAKSTLVAAINELQSEINSLTQINDAVTSTTSTWSSTKIDSEIDAAVNALVDGAPGLLDTLNELAAALGDDANFATTVTTALAGKAPTVHTHAISDVTGLQAALDGKASTASVGDTTTNFVTVFEAGLV